MEKGLATKPREAPTQTTATILRRVAIFPISEILFQILDGGHSETAASDTDGASSYGKKKKKANGSMTSRSGFSTRSSGGRSKGTFRTKRIFKNLSLKMARSKEEIEKEEMEKRKQAAGLPQKSVAEKSSQFLRANVRAPISVEQAGMSSSGGLNETTTAFGTVASKRSFETSSDENKTL